MFVVLIFLLPLGVTAGQSVSFSKLKGYPALRSASALILDASGNVIYGKDIDQVRSIASITKLMTAMVVLDAELDLDESITITKEDRDLLRLTGSRLEYGATLSRGELLQLAYPKPGRGKCPAQEPKILERECLGQRFIRDKPIFWEGFECLSVFFAGAGYRALHPF